MFVDFLFACIRRDRYTMNFYATINEPIDETEQYKQWVNNTLREARKNNEKVNNGNYKLL